MKINDAGYYKTASVEEYIFKSKVNNNTMFIKEFTKTMHGDVISGFHLLTTQELRKGQELFVEYGTDFWFHTGTA